MAWRPFESNDYEFYGMRENNVKSAAMIHDCPSDWELGLWTLRGSAVWIIHFSSDQMILRFIKHFWIWIEGCVAIQETIIFKLMFCSSFFMTEFLVHKIELSWAFSLLIEISIAQVVEA